jgi:type I restriction enzyme M protein
MVRQDFTVQTKELIDNLKGVCTSYGLGNDGNEFKIITQVFLYKFMNDKFGYEVKLADPNLNNAANWEQEVANYSDSQYERLLMRMSPDSAKLKREHYLSNLHNNQNKEEFARFFDDTLRDIAIFNNDIFSVKTGTGAKITLFDSELSCWRRLKTDHLCRLKIDQGI